MKNAVVRARIDADLKAQATVVLKGIALDMSDAIRMFLQQVVRRGGLPFPVRGRDIRVLSARQANSMKQASQARDRALVAQGVVPPESMFLISSDQVAGARVKQWPRGTALKR